MEPPPRSLVQRAAMRTLVLTLVLWLVALPALAAPRLSPVGPTPWAPWEAMRVERDGAPLDVYVARSGERRPLVVLLQGSHCAPLFWIRKEGDAVRRRSALLLEEQASKGPFHAAAIERHGLRSFSDDSDGPCTPQRGGVSKPERVGEVADAVVALAAEPWVSEVLLVGHSEGADIASGVAAKLGRKHIAAVALLAGGTATQFLDHILLARRTGDHAEAAQVFRELVQVAGETPPESYRGFPSERYRTFAVASTPLDDLRTSDVPVFVAQGTRDKNVTVENTDVFVAEMLRANPSRPLRYVVFSGLDHGFFDADGGGHSEQVWADFCSWARSPAQGIALVPAAASAPQARSQVRYFGVPYETWQQRLGPAAPALASLARALDVSLVPGLLLLLALGAGLVWRRRREAASA